MNNKSRLNTLEHIYNEHVRYRISNSISQESINASEVRTTLERLKKAVRTLRFIDEVTDSTEEIYRTFTSQRLQELTVDIANGVSLAKRLTEAAGFLDALDSYFDVIVECSRSKYFPPAELELLKSLGSHDPEKELETLVNLQRLRKWRGVYPSERIWVAEETSGTYEALNHIEERLRRIEANQEQRQHKRLFKTWGQVATGASIAISDVVNVAGMYSMPGYSKVLAIGSLVSVAAGVSTMFTGWGEWRGE